MRQRWRDLLFLHFPCEPEQIAPHIPLGLTVDTFPNGNGKEMAWIGLVLFRMEGIRWALTPPIPGANAFPETNVRTYVHRGGTDPGVHFFSLDAANRAAVLTARALFSLPYFWAEMDVHRNGERMAYSGRREGSGASYNVEATFGEERPASRPGCLDFFLAERYLLYAVRQGRLMAGRVHHKPYGLRSVQSIRVREKLTLAAQIPILPFEHGLFSEGVDVDVFPLRPVP